MTNLPSVGKYRIKSTGFVVVVYLSSFNGNFIRSLGNPKLIIDINVSNVVIFLVLEQLVERNANCSLLKTSASQCSWEI